MKRLREADFRFLDQDWRGPETPKGKFILFLVQVLASIAGALIGLKLVGVI